jgi:WD40 repeat protein
MADASNVCLPQSHPVDLVIPGLPTPEIGARCGLFGLRGSAARTKDHDAAVIVYGSRNQVVVRSIDAGGGGAAAALLPDVIQQNAFCYRGHAQRAIVSAVRVNPTGTYVASADQLGQLRIWALDNVDHRCKYEQKVLSDIIRDIDWDGEGKRIVLSGERARTGTCCLPYSTADDGSIRSRIFVGCSGRVYQTNLVLTIFPIMLMIH